MISNGEVRENVKSVHLISLSGVTSSVTGPCTIVFSLSSAAVQF